MNEENPKNPSSKPIILLVVISFVLIGVFVFAFMKMDFGSTESSSSVAETTTESPTTVTTEETIPETTKETTKETTPKTAEKQSEKTTEETTIQTTEATKATEASKTTSPINDNSWDNTTTKKPKSSALYKNQKQYDEYEAGTYEIGTDIPYGYYILISRYDAYVRDPVGTFKIDYDGEEDGYPNCFFGSIIINLTKPGTLDISFCTAYEIDAPVKENNPLERSGMFRVGIDVEPGLYNIIPDQYGASWMIYENIEAINEFRLLDGSDDTEPIPIILNDGEILKLVNGVLEKIS